MPAVDEWATSLFKELDYNREAANAMRFKQLFTRMPEVYVPEVRARHLANRGPAAYGTAHLMLTWEGY